MVRRRPLRTLGIAAALAAVWGCAAPDFVPPPFQPIPESPAREVDAVLFLVGDAGGAPAERSPLLHRLRDDVEAWSARLPDSSVAVLFLGDNVYPSGVRPRTDPGFSADSARLAGQVWTVDGPSARGRGARGLFVPGNHDWGNRTGPEGVARLADQASLLSRFRERGSPVALIPGPGAPGPAVADVGSRVRIAALDTHWWLQAGPGDEARRAEVLTRVASVLEERGSRHVVVAAHHPLVSGGPHGLGPRSLLDPSWIFHRSGALVQDLNSAPYRALRTGLSAAFRRAGPPVVFAAGHDHTLQVIQGVAPGDPRWSLVSGAGSRSSPVGPVPGMRWGTGDPGYMRLVFRADGGVELFVVSAERGGGICREGASDTCVAEGRRAFRTTFSARLR